MHRVWDVYHMELLSENGGMVRIKMFFKMGKWWGLCICATIAGRVGEETFQGNCRINGSQTQLPVRSITRAHRIIIVIIIIIINSIITIMIMIIMIINSIITIMIMNITIISDTIATTINNARTAAQLFTIDKSRGNNVGEIIFWQQSPQCGFTGGYSCEQKEQHPIY